MANLFAVVLVVGLWLAIEVLWPGWVSDTVTRSTSGEGEDEADAGSEADEADRSPIEWELLSQQFIRRRLDALVEELERLDRDPDCFAKAFHTMVARSAHDALLAEASRVPDQPPQHAGQTPSFRLVAASAGRREELEL